MCYALFKWGSNQLNFVIVSHSTLFQLREEELRRRAAIERDKELAEFQKNKKYQEDLAKKVSIQGYFLHAKIK